MELEAKDKIEGNREVLKTNIQEWNGIKKTLQKSGR